MNGKNSKSIYDTNSNDTEASAAGRSADVRALHKQSKRGIIDEGEG